MNTSPMSAGEIEKIRKALDAATPGPWEAYTHIAGAHVKAIAQIALCAENSITSVRDVESQRVDKRQCQANAHLIANAPTWLRTLLEENERLSGMFDYANRRAAVSKVSIDELYTQNQQLREELEQVKKERDKQQAYISTFVNIRTVAQNKVESLRSELTEKNKVLREVHNLSKRFGFPAIEVLVEKILSKYKEEPYDRNQGTSMD